MENVNRRQFVETAAMTAAGVAAGAALATTSSAKADEAQTPKKIMVLLGTGLRDGNTGQVVDAFAQGAQESGHEVTIFHLHEMNITPCIGCGTCREGDGTCVFQDDMTQIYDAYKECDMIVYASPVRYWMFTGMLKNVVERFFALAYEGDNVAAEADGGSEGRLQERQAAWTGNPRQVHELYPRKDAVLILTSADDTWSTFHWAKSYWETCLVNFFLYNNKGCLLCPNCGLENFDPGDHRFVEDTNHLVEAYEFGKNIYAPVGDSMTDTTVMLTNEYNYDK